MTKPPLHNIDSLFQQKLEELPVDLEQQQAQWMALSQTIHRPTGLRYWVRKPWIKGLYMMIVALVPFGIFYLSNQSQTIESNASAYTPGIITNSLRFLNTIESSTKTNNVYGNRQNLLPSETREASGTLPPNSTPTQKWYQAETSEQPAKTKDSVRTVPAKQEKPAVKKADSTYIYWQ